MLGIVLGKVIDWIHVVWSSLVYFPGELNVHKLLLLATQYNFLFDVCLCCMEHVVCGTPASASTNYDRERHKYDV
jgi:hypothetical protein